MYELKVYNEDSKCYFRADLALEGTLEEVTESFSSIVRTQCSSRVRFGSRWVNLDKSAYYEVAKK